MGGCQHIYNPDSPGIKAYCTLAATHLINEEDNYCYFHYYYRLFSSFIEKYNKIHTEYEKVVLKASENQYEDIYKQIENLQKEFLILEEYDFYGNLSEILNGNTLEVFRFNDYVVPYLREDYGDLFPPPPIKQNIEELNPKTDLVLSIPEGMQSFENSYLKSAILEDNSEIEYKNTSYVKSISIDDTSIKFLNLDMLNMFLRKKPYLDYENFQYYYENIFNIGDEYKYKLIQLKNISFQNTAFYIGADIEFQFCELKNTSVHNFMEGQQNLDITFKECNITVDSFFTVTKGNLEFLSCNFDRLDINPTPRLRNNLQTTVLIYECLMKRSMLIYTNKLEIINLKSNGGGATLYVPFENLYLSNSLDMFHMFKNISVLLWDGWHGDQNRKKIDKPSEEIKEEPLLGYLHYVDLSKIHFLPTASLWRSGRTIEKDTNSDNLKKLNFVNCHFNNGHKLYEEEVELKRLEYSYLYLRELYDKRGDYIAGNDFHYNYYEIKRKHDINLSKIDKLMLGLYGYLNGYNTKPARTIGWLGVVFIAFWLIFGVCLSFLKGLKIAGISYEPLNFWSAFGGGFYTALSGLLPTSLISSSITSENIIILVLMHLESLISTILLVLFIFALRNRFRRSKDPVDIGK